VRSVALVGRTSELQRLCALTEQARSGHGGVVLLGGAPGIGKTRLAEEAAQAARSLGLLTSWGRAWEGGGAPPFWPWIQIIRAIRKTGITLPSELAQLVPELGGVAHPAFAPGADRFLLFDAMQRLLFDAGTRQPLMLLFDDLHSADAASVQLLSFVAPSLGDVPVLIIGTYRDVEARMRPELGELLANLGRTAISLRVNALAREAVAELAEAHLPGSVSPSEVDALYVATDGNPLYCNEILHVVAAEGKRTDGSYPLPDSIRAAIRRHLDRVRPELRRPLEHAAVLGHEFAATVLAALLDESLALLMPLLSEATAMGILVERLPSRFVFAHGLFREVIYADLPDRGAIHHRIAEVLENVHEADPTALTEIARHWLDAGPLFAPRAREAARRAAQAATVALAYEEAAELCEKAIVAHDQASPGDVAGRCEILLAMADAQMRAGDLAGGKKTSWGAATLARRIGDRRLFSRIALMHGSAVTPGSVDADLVALLEEASAMLGKDEPALRAQLLARLASAQQPAFDPRGPIAKAREAIALVDHDADRPTRMSVLHLAMAAMMDFVDPVERRTINEEILELATSLGERTVALRAAIRLFHDHAEIGDLSGAARRLDAYDAMTRSFPQPHVRFAAELGRSLILLVKGNFSESQRYTAEARDIAIRTRDTHARWILTLHEIGSLRIRDEDEALAERRDELRSSLDRFEDRAAAYDAMLAGRRGEVDEARAALARMGKEHARVCMDTMHGAWLAEAAVLVGDASWGRVIEEMLAPLEHEWASFSGVGFIIDSPVARARALAAAARRDWPAALRHFDAALDAALAIGARPVAARIRVEWAEIFARRGEPGDVEAARGLLDDARADVEALGLRCLASRMRTIEQGARSAIDPQTVAFAREGEFWNVSGEGAVVRLKHSRGIEMLAKLVASPGRELHALDLSGDAADGVVDVGDAGEAIDDEARDAYRERISELEDDLDQAEARNDPGHAERARTELEALRAELARAVGLGGRVRRTGRAAERARVNVQRRLVEAIRKVAEACPALGLHLQKAVRTGAFCSYAPDRARR
jgi:tetratricopeptide (TPR) repeat protein